MYGGLHSPGPLPTPGALVDLAREFTPRVEAFGSTPVLLDLQGLGRAWPSPRPLGEALLEAARRRCPEPRVALAVSRVAALLISQGREGLTVLAPGEETAALAPLPLSLLALDPDREETLRGWGLRTLGDLAALPAAGLAARCIPPLPRPIPARGARSCSSTSRSIRRGTRSRPSRCARSPPPPAPSSSRCSIPHSPRPSAWRRRWLACTSGPRPAAAARPC